MKFKRFTLTMATVLATVGLMSAQSYFDDDIYYNPSKATKTTKTQSSDNSAKKNTVIVYDYPSADTYSVNGTRKISVDDYNRRGIFASDSLSADTTATDFAYTRRIEQFYNPQIVSASGDQDLANIYYMEPDQVNIYINTPSGYWGYDYFYPYSAWNSPYWYNNYWRWNSSWYWGSWYDPYWSWGWGPSWAWGPSWGWGPGWGGGHAYNPRHPGAMGVLPNHSGSSATGSRPSLTNGGRHYGVNGNYSTNRPSINSRPGYTNSTQQSGTTNRRPSLSNSNSNSRPAYNSNSNNSNNNYNRQGTTNGGRYNNSNNNNYNYNSGNYNSGSFGGGRSSGGYSGGGSTRSSGGGRGRH